MSKYVCTCPGCNANFEIVSKEAKKAACPACSCEVALEQAVKTDAEEQGGGCAGCSGCSNC